jgi:hypothetical protein
MRDAVRKTDGLGITAAALVDAGGRCMAPGR